MYIGYSPHLYDHPNDAESVERGLVVSPTKRNGIFWVLCRRESRGAMLSKKIRDYVLFESLFTGIFVRKKKRKEKRERERYPVLCIWKKERAMRGMYAQGIACSPISRPFKRFIRNSIKFGERSRSNKKNRRVRHHKCDQITQYFCTRVCSCAWKYCYCHM